MDLSLYFMINTQLEMCLQEPRQNKTPIILCSNRKPNYQESLYLPFWSFSSIFSAAIASPHALGATIVSMYLFANLFIFLAIEL